MSDDDQVSGNDEGAASPSGGIPGNQLPWLDNTGGNALPWLSDAGSGIPGNQLPWLDSSGANQLPWLDNPPEPPTEAVSYLTWNNQLRQASWRGVPFGVLGEDTTFSRRQIAHQYPFRDKPWIEDMGAGLRKIGLQGFLLSDSRAYDGGSAITQREQFLGACNLGGPGTLVHPTLGQLTVSLLSASIRARADAGGYFELELSFIESGARVFPSVLTATADAVNAAAATASSAASADFTSRLTDAPLSSTSPSLLDQAKGYLSQGAAVVQQAVSTVQGYAGQALHLASDATGIFNQVSQLSGNFGRFVGAGNSGFLGSTGNIGSGLGSALSTVNSIRGLAAQAASARTQITHAANDLTSTAESLGL